MGKCITKLNFSLFKNYEEGRLTAFEPTLAPVPSVQEVHHLNQVRHRRERSGAEVPRMCCHKDVNHCMLQSCEAELGRDFFLESGIGVGGGEVGEVRVDVQTWRRRDVREHDNLLVGVLPKKMLLRLWIVGQ